MRNGTNQWCLLEMLSSSKKNQKGSKYNKEEEVQKSGKEATTHHGIEISPTSEVTKKVL